MSDGGHDVIPDKPSVIFRKVSDHRCLVGECPLWHPAEKVVYWIDVQAPALYRYDPQSEAVEHWRLDEKIGTIAWLPDGGLIAGMATGIYRLDPAEDGLRKTSVINASLGRHYRFNDGAVDGAGRFLVGTMKDPNDGSPGGQLFCVTGSSVSSPLIEGLVIQNGVAFSPDGTTMYLSDAHRSVQKVWAFDYELETGSISGRRVFVDMCAYDGRPDGSTVDKAGYLWVAANESGRLLRFTPDGHLDRAIQLPVTHFTMCAFGGGELKTLYVTTIGRDQPGSRRLSEDTLAGCLLAAELDIVGIEEPAFAL